MSTPTPTETRSQQIFKAADPTTQKLIKAFREFVGNNPPED